MLWSVPPVRTSRSSTLHFAGKLASLSVASLHSSRGTTQPLAVYIRVTSENGRDSYFGQRLNLPRISEQRRKQMNWGRFKLQVEFSGAVAVGEGQYKAEILLVDNRNRIHRNHWKFKVAAKGKEKSIQPAIRPNSVARFIGSSWRAQEQNRGRSSFDRASGRSSYHSSSSEAQGLGPRVSAWQFVLVGLRNREQARFA